MVFQLTENEKALSLLERLTHSSWIYTRRHTERNAASFRVSGMFYQQRENGGKEQRIAAYLGTSQQMKSSGIILGSISVVLQRQNIHCILY